MKAKLPNSVVVPAALAGVAVAAVVAVLGATLQDYLTAGNIPDLHWLVFFIPLWIFACIVFLLGFLFLGIPAWFAAHYFHRTHWYDGAVIGAVLAAVSVFLFTLPTGTASASVGGFDLVVNGHFTPKGWMNALELTGIMAAAGATGGMVIWRMAYRNQEMS